MAGFIRLGDMPIGAKIKFGKYQVESEYPQSIVWTVAHHGYYDTSCASTGKKTTSLLASKVVDLRCFDWMEYNRPGTVSSDGRKARGYGDYSVSNINLWLNSDKSGGSWWTKQHDYDAPPDGVFPSGISYTDLAEQNMKNTAYKDHHGFLYYFTQQEKNMLVTMNLSKNDGYPGIWEAHCASKVYLLSAKEWSNALGFDGVYDETLELAQHHPDYAIKRRQFLKLTKACVDNTLVRIYMSDNSTDRYDENSQVWISLRDPAYTTSDDIKNQGQIASATHGSGGNYLAYYANSVIGILPVINLDLDTLVSATLDSDGCYSVLEDQSTPSHTHNWSTDWSFDSTHHWHECLVSNCPNTQNAEKSSYAPHTASDWIVTQEATDKAPGSKHKVCTICGYEMEVEEIPKLPGFDGKKLSSMANGTKIKFGKYQVGTETPEDIIWVILDKNHSGYPSNSVTLMTEKIIDFLGYDAIEASNPDSRAKARGNGRWKYSNIRQWLNSDKSSGWYTAQHTYDAPPIDANLADSVNGYSTKKGFLNLFTSDEKDMILLTENLPSIIYGNENGTVVDYTNDKIFLPSATELSKSLDYADGKAFSNLSTTTQRTKYSTQQAFDYSNSTTKPSKVTSAYYYRTRSQLFKTTTTTYQDCVYTVTSSGSVSAASAGATYCYAYKSEGIVPMCNVSGNCLVSDIPDSDGCYTIQPAPPHVHTWSTLWSTDETAHWHECLISDCDITVNSQKDGYGLHEESDWIIEKPATYYEIGHRKKICTICGYLMEEEDIPMLEIPEELTVEIKNPIWTDHMISTVYVTSATEKEVAFVESIFCCNNAFDTEPTWEDITESVIEKDPVQLKNTNKSSEEWGLSLRITLRKEFIIPNKKVILNSFAISYN